MATDAIGRSAPMSRVILAVAGLLAAGPWVSAEPILGLTSEILDRHFLVGDRLLVSQWKCKSSAEGVFIVAFDRARLVHTSTIKVADCDTDYQDSVENVYLRGEQIIANLQFRYASDVPERPNTVVIDANSFAVKSRLNAAEAEANGYPVRKIAIDDELQETAGMRIVPNGEYGNRFLVQRAGIAGPDVLPCPDNMSGGPVKLIDQDTAVMRTLSPDGLRIRLHLADLQNLTCELVFDEEIFELVPPRGVRANGHMSNLVSVDGQLIFGFNRDLHVFDLRNLEGRVVRDFVPVDHSALGTESKLRRIERVVLDPDQRRILVFCLTGACNSYIPVSKLRTYPGEPWSSDRKTPKPGHP